MIVMLNGAFGVGKTTLANALLAQRPDWMHFDPEEVGAMLWKICPEPRGDFQDLKAWAPLVIDTARTLMATYGRPLVVPMTLVHEANYHAIREGFARIAETHHFTLMASPETITQRLVLRGDAPDSWSHQQIERCVAVLDRPEFAVHVDAERPVEVQVQVITARVLDPSR
jgi:predicted kinase